MSDPKKTLSKDPEDKTPTVTGTQSALVVGRQAVDLEEEGYEGSYKHIAFRGTKEADEAFGLKVDASDPRGKTHQLKSQLHFWEGTEEEFRANFEKK